MPALVKEHFRCFVGVCKLILRQASQSQDCNAECLHTSFPLFLAHDAIRILVSLPRIFKFTWNSRPKGLLCHCKLHLLSGLLHAAWSATCRTTKLICKHFRNVICYRAKTKIIKVWETLSLSFLWGWSRDSSGLFLCMSVWLVGWVEFFVWLVC